MLTTQATLIAFGKTELTNAAYGLHVLLSAIFQEW